MGIIALRAIFCLGLILLVLSCSMNSEAQSPNINYSNLHYNVKTGDKNTYDLVKVILLNSEQSSGQFPLKNGSLMDFNIKKGEKIVITVITVNKSSNDNEQVFVTEKLTIPNKGSFVSQIMSESGVIFPSFENKSIALLYFNQTSYFGTPANISFNGDFISFDSNQSYITNLTSLFKIVINWKTGWLESDHQYSVFTNGTIYEDFLIERERTDLVKTIIESGIFTIDLGLVLVLIIIPTYLVISYKRYTKSTNAQEIIPFSTFVKMKINKVNKKKEKQNKFIGHDTDKALAIIDEIIKENKDL